MAHRTLGLTGVSNARQLGGYFGAEGRKVKNTVLLRSGSLYGASEEELERLTKEYGLTVIIDLRTEQEIKEKPDPIPEGVVYHAIPVMGEDSTRQLGIVEIYRAYPKDPGKAYIEMLRRGALSENMYTGFFDSEQSMKAYRRFFDVLLSHEQGAVLWHCTGGKDRTGLATVMVLSLLGVDRETILEDFARINQDQQKRISVIVEAAKPYAANAAELEQVAALVGVSVPYMEKVFERAEAECGSMIAFVKQKVGVTEEEVQILRRKYLES